MSSQSLIAMMVCVVGLTATHLSADERWTHPASKPLQCSKDGPFVQLDDGALLAVEKNVLVRSDDGGKAWTAISDEIHPGMNLSYHGHVGQLLRTKTGTLVILFLNFDNYKFSWDNERNVPKDDCRLELWSVRSVDGGKTWESPHRLLDGYNADFMGLIQTRDGGLVATVEHLSPDLARWLVCSFHSADDGRTWIRSNWIDLGGRGHHDGAIEPTVAELRDGRLLMLIRTTLDRFWSAYSTDGGRHWREIKPTGIDASSAPGWLTRLASGRLVFVWNRIKAEGATEVPRREPGPSSASRPSWFREELSVAFSDDDGDTWSKPVVIAREPGSQIAYPYLLEREPGILWVFTRYNWDSDRQRRPPVSLEFREVDLLEP